MGVLASGLVYRLLRLRLRHLPWQPHGLQVLHLHLLLHVILHQLVFIFFFLFFDKLVGVLLVTRRGLVLWGAGLLSVVHHAHWRGSKLTLVDQLNLLLQLNDLLLAWAQLLLLLLWRLLLGLSGSDWLLLLCLLSLYIYFLLDYLLLLLRWLVLGLGLVHHHKLVVGQVAAGSLLLWLLIWELAGSWLRHLLLGLLGLELSASQLLLHWVRLVGLHALLAELLHEKLLILVGSWRPVDGSLLHARRLHHRLSLLLVALYGYILLDHRLRRLLGLLR